MFAVKYNVTDFDNNLMGVKEDIFYLINEKPKGITNVSAFYADDHELLVIQTMFENIPTRHGWCAWNGEIAQFIYDNLK